MRTFLTNVDSIVSHNYIAHDEIEIDIFNSKTQTKTDLKLYRNTLSMSLNICFTTVSSILLLSTDEVVTYSLNYYYQYFRSINFIVVGCVNNSLVFIVSQNPSELKNSVSPC